MAEKLTREMIEGQRGFSNILKGKGKSMLPEESGSVRKRVEALISSDAAEACITFIVVLNMVMVWVECDFAAPKYEQPDVDPEVPLWLQALNTIFLTVYTLEISVRLFVYRTSLFCDFWSVTDFCIVAIDLSLWVGGLVFEKDIPSVSLLRLMRLLRVARALRFLHRFPELHIMVRGLVSAFKAIFWGAALIGIVLAIWSILGVQIIHPINLRVARSGYYNEIGCDRCPVAFQSVGQSILTFTQQIIAGDSWGQISIPIIEEAPLTVIYFVSVLVSVGLAIMNLMLAVVVEKASEARQDSIIELAAAHEATRTQAQHELLDLCAQLDMDGSGNLSIDELKNGFDTFPAFAARMEVMDVHKGDMEMVFRILDEDGSGDVDYKEFVDQLHKMKQHDAHTLLVFIKYYVMEINVKVSKEISKLRQTLLNKVDGLVESGCLKRGPSVSNMSSLQLGHDAAKAATAADGNPEDDEETEPRGADDEGGERTCAASIGVRVVLAGAGAGGPAEFTGHEVEQVPQETKPSEVLNSNGSDVGRDVAACWDANTSEGWLATVTEQLLNVMKEVAYKAELQTNLLRGLTSMLSHSSATAMVALPTPQRQAAAADASKKNATEPKQMPPARLREAASCDVGGLELARPPPTAGATVEVTPLHLLLQQQQQMLQQQQENLHQRLQQLERLQGVKPRIINTPSSAPAAAGAQPSAHAPSRERGLMGRSCFSVSQPGGVHDATFLPVSQAEDVCEPSKFSRM